MELKAAQERFTSGLPALAERSLLLTILRLDDANIRIDGHEERIAALRSSPLSYSRDKQIQLLVATYADLRAKERRTEDSAFELLNRQPAGITNNWKSLPLYLSKRAEFANRFKDQSLNAEELAGDIQLLQDYPLPLVLSGMINAKNCRAWIKLADGAWRSPGGINFLADGNLRPALPVQVAPKEKPKIDPAATTLKQLERKTSELDRAVNRLQAQQSNIVSDLSSRAAQSSKEAPEGAGTITPNRRIDAVLSNSLAVKTANPVPATNRVVEQVTQTVASITIKLPVNSNVPLPSNPNTATNTNQTNQPQSLLAKGSNTTAPSVSGASLVNGKAGNPPSNADESKAVTGKITATTNVMTDIPRAKQPRTKLVWLGFAGATLLALIVAVTLGLAFVNRRGSEFEMLLKYGSTDREQTINLSFDSREQCVILDADRPSVEARGAEGDQPCIIVLPLSGPQLCIGTAVGVRLNDEPILKPKRLHAGDVIQISTADRNQRFVFQAGNYVSAEEQPAPFESPTTTIN